MSTSSEKTSTRLNAWYAPETWSNKTAWTIVWGITVLGLAFRLLQVDQLTLWVDEYVHVLRAKGVVDGTGNLFTHDNNGILLTMFIIPLYELFGASAFTSRLPSVLFGAASIPLTYLLARRLFNNYIGVLAALLNACSLYLVFWSRVTRNYAIFEFFFLLLLLTFLSAFEPEKAKESLRGFWKRTNIHPKYLLLIPVVLILAVMSHQLAFFFVFGVGVYFLGNAIVRLFAKGDESKFRNKYFIIGTLFLVFIALIFLPFMRPFTSSLLGLFLPEGVVDWVLPDWAYLGELWETHRHRSYDRYADVISYDLGKMHLIGLLGLIVAFFYNKRSAIFLWGFFVVPFLMLSYLFREPYVPRYILFVYPVFLISMSVTLYAVVDLLRKYVFKKRTSWVGAAVLMALPAIVLASQIQWSELMALAKAEKRNGNVVDMKLTRWSFTNWADPCKKLKPLIQEGDVILSTIPGSAMFYLDNPDIVRFRQRKYSSEARGYVPMGEDPNLEKSANTVESLRKLVETYPRGWLIADYYLFGPLTGPKAREYVFRNMTYHFNFSEWGDVYLFSWDHSRPAVPKATLIDLGKGGKYASRELEIQLPDAKQFQYMVFYIDVEGIDYNEEAVVVFNQSYQQFLPATPGGARQQVGIRIPTSSLVAGTNRIQFGYHPKDKPAPADVHKGFAIYNIQATGAN